MARSALVACAPSRTAQQPAPQVQGVSKKGRGRAQAKEAPKASWMRGQAIQARWKGARWQTRAAQALVRTPVAQAACGYAAMLGRRGPALERPCARTCRAHILSTRTSLCLTRQARDTAGVPGESGHCFWRSRPRAYAGHGRWSIGRRRWSAPERGGLPSVDEPLRSPCTEKRRGARSPTAEQA